MHSVIAGEGDQPEQQPATAGQSKGERGGHETAVTSARPWYRRPKHWIVAVLALVAGAGLALGLLFTVFAATPTPESTLAHDGYRVSASMNQQQVSSAVSGSASGVSFLKGTFTGAATGTKGGTTEVAFELAKGQTASTVLTEVQQSVGQGVTARTEGSFLVMSGPAASFSGTGSQALGFTPTPESVVSHDGYTVISSMDQQEVDNAIKAAPAADQVSFLKGTFTGAATGTKGGTTEVAFELAKGQAASTVLTEVQQSVGPGVTARTEGRFLVMSGPAASFSGTGSQALGFTPTPESVVRHDGYTVISSMDQQQIDNAIKAAPAADQASFLKGMFTGAAVGTNGGSEEVALGLTPKGQAVISIVLPAIQARAGVSTHMEGNFLVMRGTASQFNGTGSGALAF